MSEIAALFQQALVHYEAGRLAETTEACIQVLARDRSHSDALNLFGVVANRLGRYDMAVQYLAVATRLADTNASYHNNLGQALMGLGRYDEAADSFRRALALSPTMAEGYGNLAVALRNQGKAGEAMLLLRRAIALKPDFAAAHNNLANMLAERGQLDGALEHYDRALAASPLDPDLHVNRASLLMAQNRIGEAIESFRAAHGLRPDNALMLKCALALPIIPGSVAEIETARRDLRDTIEALRRHGMTLADPNRQIGQTCFHLAYHGLDDLPLQRALAELYESACPSLLTTAAHCRAPAPTADGRIHIGFASYFFRTHTIALLFQGLIAELSRERFHVTVLATPFAPDAAREALIGAADEFVELPLDLAAARERIAACALDILVYPDIGMSPLTYFLAFARLAPVQCVSWGHPDTTGIGNLDYFLSCDAMEPDGAEAHYSERLVRLPGPTIYYARPAYPPRRFKKREALGLDPAAHLYTCPQSLFKFHPDFDAVLIEILRRDPGGRLVLPQGADRRIDELLIARLTRDAPDIAARIVMMPTLSRGDFVALLATSDVMLDPLHYSGGNTSLEAFSVGTPIVTWPGAFMRGRHTYGFYRLMGVDDCIARDHADYVELALRLGTQPDRRAEVSRRIREASNVLFENAGSVRALEAFLAEALARARA